MSTKIHHPPARFAQIRIAHAVPGDIDVRCSTWSDSDIKENTYDKIVGVRMIVAIEYIEASQRFKVTWLKMWGSCWSASKHIVFIRTYARTASFTTFIND